MVTLEAITWLRSAAMVRRSSKPLFLDAHGCADVADGDAGPARGGLSDQCSSSGQIVLLDEFHFALELIEPRGDRGAQFSQVVGLRRIVADQMRELVGIRLDIGDGCVVICPEFRPLRQQEAARGTLGAADFQQQRVDLVFGLDSVGDPAGVVARLVDQQHRGDADGDQHEKSG